VTDLLLSGETTIGPVCFQAGGRRRQPHLPCS